MKICIISSDFTMESFGGRSTSLKRIMDGITEKDPGTEFHIITKKSKDRFGRKGKIFYYRLDNFEKNAKEIVKKLDEKIDFDLIHGFDIYPDGCIAVSASSLLKKRCIVGIRGTYILRSIDSICKYIAKKADYIVSVDKASVGIFKKITGRKNKIITIKNSVLIPKTNRNKTNKENFIIGNVSYLGNLRRLKGWNYILDAFAKIRKDMPKSRLVLIGANMDKTSKIRKRIENSGGDIILKGLLKHKRVLEAIQDFDVYVSPSIFEGIPNAVLEAMALKKPVIATRVGGVDEIIKNGYNGLLIKPFSAEEIYKNVVALYKNKEERKRFGINAYNTVIKKFNPKGEIESWHELYKMLCQNR